MAARSTEVETKLGVHGLFVVPDLSDPAAGVVEVQQRPPLALRATYVDTPALRLAREGITLRHRTGEGAPRWTLKLPNLNGSSNGLSRDELSVDGPMSTLPDELRTLLVAVLRGQDVHPVAVLKTDRSTVVLLDAEGGLLAEVVDDTVSVLQGRRVVTRFREIEVEQGEAAGAADACRAVTERLLAAGAVAAEQLPKVVRALGPRAQEPSDLPAPPVVDARSPAGDLVLSALRTALARVVANDLGVRRAEHDAVHQMRVACRRLRSDLRTFRALVEDERVGPLRDELKWLAGSLGEARDLEVLLERVDEVASRDPLCALEEAGVADVRRLLQRNEDKALAAAHEALASPRYLALLQLLVDVADEPRLTELAAQPCRDVLPPMVGGAWDHVARRAGKLHTADPDEEWHRARILAKRARYAAEAVAVVLGKPARRTAAAAERVQEVLGEHQDAAYAADHFLALPRLEPGNGVLAVTCGRLAERERAHIRTVRDGFPKAWRKARRKGATGWMRG